MASPKPISPRLVSIRDVCVMTSLSRTSVWLKVKAGSFPQPISLGVDGGRKAFVAAEVETWIDQQIAARDRAVAA